MATTLDDLLIGLGFDYDPEELNEFREDIGAVNSVLKSMIKVATLAATAITGITVASTAASDEQGKLAELIGINVEQLDALQFANKRSGDSADGLSSSLTNLAKISAEAAMGVGSGTEAFGRLGISVTNASGQLKPVNDLLLEVSTRLQGFGNLRQLELADKLGLADSLKLLRLGPIGIKELTDRAKELGVVTGEDAFIAAEFQDALTDLFQILKQMGRLVSSVVAPALKFLADSLTNIWVNTKAIIDQNLGGWVDTLITSLKVLSIVIGFLLASNILIFISKIGLLFKVAATSVFTFIGSLLTIPVLIGAIVTGIALLANDAKAFFNGQQSLIGDMLIEYPRWRTAILSVAKVFATVADLTDRVIDGWKIIFDLFSKIDFGKAFDFITSLPDKIGDAVTLGAVSLLTDGSGIAGDITNTPISNTSNTSNNRSSRVVNVDNVKIDVNGAGNPQVVSEVLANQFTQALQDVESSVEQ